MHGHNNVLGAVIFPHNIGLGCTRNPKLIEKVQRVTAEEIRATGIQWAFAPCVTVPQDIRWGRTYEGFSEDPKLVRELGAAPPSAASRARVSTIRSACWPAPSTSSATAARPSARRARPGSTRATRASTKPRCAASICRATSPPSRPASAPSCPPTAVGTASSAPASKRLLTDILKKELGFEGFLISDYNAIDQISSDFKEAVGISINAGMDMVMVPTRYREYFDDLKALVNEGKVPMSRIDDAVTAHPAREVRHGPDGSQPQPAGRPQPAEELRLARTSRRGPPGGARVAGAAQEREQGAAAVEERAARIHVAGKNADDIGNQCGGWTIDWQGKSGDVTTGGTTILAAIKNTVSKDTKVTFSKDGTGAAGADRGRRRDRRDALRGNEGRPRRPRARARRHRGRERR